MFPLSACQDNTDMPDNFYADFEETLLRKYPDAVDIVWSEKEPYVLADFKTSKVQTKGESARLFSNTAWFDEDGHWQMTQSDAPFEALPKPVQDAFLAGEYADWEIDDIDIVNRDNVEFIYVIEVENIVDGKEAEVDLYYTEDGLLVKVVVDPQDDGYEDFIPDDMSDKIESFIVEKYPDARIIEVEVEDGRTEVEIVDINIEREILFNRNDDWLYTETEMNYRDLPLCIQKTFEASPYADCRIDDEIEHYLMPDKEFYRFELEDKFDDKKIDIYPDGTIVEVKSNENRD